METKLCTKCGQVKPVSEFGLNKSKKDGLQCRALKSIENSIMKIINNIIKIRLELVEEYKSKLICSKCGENRWWLLDFHHTNPSEKDCEVTKLIDAPNKLKKELEKCIVLCANCHRHLHYTHQELIE